MLLGPRLGKHGVAGRMWPRALSLGSFVLSVIGAGSGWCTLARELSRCRSYTTPGTAPTPALKRHGRTGRRSHADEATSSGDAVMARGRPPEAFTGNWYTLGNSASCKLTISYYIDSLDRGHVRDGDADRHVHPFLCHRLHARRVARRLDHEVRSSDGHHLHRHGRFHRFFQYLRCSASACWDW